MSPWAGCARIAHRERAAERAFRCVGARDLSPLAPGRARTGTRQTRRLSRPFNKKEAGNDPIDFDDRHCRADRGCPSGRFERTAHRPKSKVLLPAWVDTMRALSRGTSRAGTCVTGRQSVRGGLPGKATAMHAYLHGRARLVQMLCVLWRRSHDVPAGLPHVAPCKPHVRL